MQIEKHGANWRLTLSDMEIGRIRIALATLVAQDPLYYKDQAAMYADLGAAQRFESVAKAEAR